MIKPLAYFLGDSAVGRLRRNPISVYFNGNPYCNGNLVVGAKLGLIQYYAYVDFQVKSVNHRQIVDFKYGLNGIPRHCELSLATVGKTLLKKEITFTSEVATVFGGSGGSRPYSIPAPEGFEISQKSKTWLITYTPSLNQTENFTSFDPIEEKWGLTDATCHSIQQIKVKGGSAKLYVISESQLLGHTVKLFDGGRRLYSTVENEAGRWELVTKELLDACSLTELQEMAAYYTPGPTQPATEIPLIPLSLF